MTLKNFHHLNRPILLKQCNSKHLDSIKTFNAELILGFDGFKFDVKSNKDGASSVVCNNVVTELHLVTALELPYKLFNVEFSDDHSWRQALAAAEASRVLAKILFSSTDHSSILQLWSNCHEAKCGLRWEDDEAFDLNHETLANLPTQLMIHISYNTVKARPSFWERYQSRLVVWGINDPITVNDTEFKPAIRIIGSLDSV